MKQLCDICNHALASAYRLGVGRDLGGVEGGIGAICVASTWRELFDDGAHRERASGWDQRERESGG